MTRVSIVIPTFNRIALIGDTIKSILNQTLSPSEVIIVDDHSTDGTSEYLKSMFGGKVMIVTNEGKGPGAARNTGLKIASGEYIKFFDSDDLMTANTLEHQVKVLQSSDKGCVYSPYFFAYQLDDINWNVSNNTIIQERSFPVQKTLCEWMLRGLFIVIPSFLFKKEFLHKVGMWRSDIHTYEDWDYLWRIGQLDSKPLHVSGCAFLYRKHNDQITGNFFSDKQRDRDKVACLRGIYKHIKESSAYSYADKLYLRLMIEKTLDQISTTLPDASLEMSRSLMDDLFAVYFRFTNKLGRIITRSDWQPMHGPCIDPEKLSEYLKAISPDYKLVSK